MTELSVTAAITEGTQFIYPDYPGCLELDPDLGFLTVRGSEANAIITILGYSPLSSGETPSSLTFATTELAFVPPQDRTIDKQGKGVGMRLYNTPHAIAGRAEQTTYVAAYTAEIALDHLIDMRKTSDRLPSGVLQRIGRHAGRIIRSQTQGLEAVVDAIHAEYGDAQSVLFNQPPRARIRERMRGVHSPIPSKFLLVRSRQIALYGVGVRYSL